MVVITMLGKTLCIGVGSMGGALLRGALQHGVLKASDTHILVRREEQCKALTEELGVVGFTTMPNVHEYNTLQEILHNDRVLVHELQKSILIQNQYFRGFQGFDIHRETVFGGEDESRCKELRSTESLYGELFSFCTDHLRTYCSIAQNIEGTGNGRTHACEIFRFIRFKGMLVQQNEL